MRVLNTMRVTWLSQKWDDRNFKGWAFNGQPSGRDQFGAIENYVFAKNISHLTSSRHTVNNALRALDFA
jgi:hypothetical protein